jgi:geranylgeranyl diphosphate synthase type II
MLILKKYKTLFEDYLHQNPFTGVPSELYDPVQYIMHLGGKRLRPAMAMMGYELFREDLEKALPVAMAVEVFHNFSLVHDDIMDEAAVRRGKPTVHKQFGDNAAILSGDVMLVLAGQMITDLEETALIAPLMRIFNRAAIEVCEGQQMDMNFETRQDVSIPEYIKMIGLKTAALLAASLEMGTVTAGASKEDVQNVYDFGYQIGIAFQLQDDILDTFGDPEVFGKKIGGDIVQNKKTFLILKAMEVAGEEQKERLEELMNTSTQNEKEKIEEVTGLLKSLNIPALAEAEKNKYKKLAFDSLDKVNGSDSGKVVLKELAELIVGREI